MESMQKTLDKALSNMPYEMLVNLIEGKHSSHGLRLSEREKTQLMKSVRAGNINSFHLREWPWLQGRNVSVEITEEDVHGIYEKHQRFTEKQLPGLLQKIIEKLSKDLLHALKRGWKAESKLQIREQRAFEKRLKKKWGNGIDCLKMMLTISREFGESTYQRLCKDDDSNSTLRLEVLTRLHARACQVADEITCLITHGFADGAMARWRTLHEIAVVAYFIYGHGEETALRYKDHQIVESYNAAKKYKECSVRLGYEPISQNDFDSVKMEFDKAIEKHGDAFKNEYGWAAKALVNNENPRLYNIEQAVGISHFRAHYKMASHNVHANPKGVYFKLGLVDGSDVLLSGPSSFGLADPGDCAAISLMQVTTVLGLIKPNIDSLVTLKIIGDLQKEIGETLSETTKST